MNRKWVMELMNIPDYFQKQLLDTVEWYYILDEETDLVVYTNEAFLNLCGREILSKPCREALAGSPFLRLFQAPVPDQEILDWELAIGESSYYMIVRNRIVAYEGHRYRIGVISRVTDIIGISWELSSLTLEYQQVIKENERLLSDLGWNAYHDQLTRLGNRNKYIDDCETIFMNETGYGVINLDINNLKWTNDHYGHSQGDRLICATGDALRELEEEGKTYCYRVGGDEFLLIRRGCTSEYLASAAEQIREHIRHANEQADFPPCNVAIGSAMAESGMNYEAVSTLADDRMYEEKAAYKKSSFFI